MTPFISEPIQPRIHPRKHILNLSLVLPPQNEFKKENKFCAYRRNCMASLVGMLCWRTICWSRPQCPPPTPCSMWQTGHPCKKKQEFSHNSPSPRVSAGVLARDFCQMPLIVATVRHVVSCSSENVNGLASNQKQVLKQVR